MTGSNGILGGRLETPWLDPGDSNDAKPAQAMERVVSRANFGGGNHLKMR